MDSNDRMLRIGQVQELVGLSRPSLYRRMRDSGFPRPRRMGPRASRWSEVAVREWLEARPEGGGDSEK